MYNAQKCWRWEYLFGVKQKYSEDLNNRLAIILMIQSSLIIKLSVNRMASEYQTKFSLLFTINPMLV